MDSETQKITLDEARRLLLTKPLTREWYDYVMSRVEIKNKKKFEYNEKDEIKIGPNITLSRF